MAADYEKLYLYLFNRITDALGELYAGRVDTAGAVRAEAQMRTEEMYIDEEKGLGNAPK